MPRKNAPLSTTKTSSDGSLFNQIDNHHSGPLKGFNSMTSGSSSHGKGRKKGSKMARQDELIRDTPDADPEMDLYDDELEAEDDPLKSNVDKADQPATSSSSLTARQIQKLKKKKQRGQLTEEETAQYSDILQVKQSVSGKATKEALFLAEHGNRFNVQSDGSGGSVPQPSTGLVNFHSKIAVESMGRDILIDSITISYQSKILIQEADLKLVFGRKYGLIGPNGAGKTTLLRDISSRNLPIQSHIRILHVEQEASASDQSAVLSVLEADTERLELLQLERNLKELSMKETMVGIKAAEELLEVSSKLRSIHAYTAESRASNILTGLQFTPEMKQKPTREFSGGWRMRIALARALFLNPDLLILDEPSNHLDLNAVIWLQAYLKKWKKTLLVVSHDRDFLNYFVTDIIHLHQQKLIYYRGDYDTFEKTVSLVSRTSEKTRKKEEKRLQHLQQVQTIKANEEKKAMRPLMTKKEKTYRVQFTFQTPEYIQPPIINIDGMSFAFRTNPNQLIFKNVDRCIDLESRIGIVGPNGAGKSTFINLILGELEPTHGRIIRNRRLRTIKFAQHFVEELEMSENAIAYIEKNHPTMSNQEIRTTLGSFGLSGKMHTNPISLLSGGQKSRVMFTNISLRSPHIMFLDEPTNHLDIQSVDALADGLSQFPGGIVLISHDQRLISKVCDEIWVISGNQQVIRYEGTFEDYRQELIDAMDDSLFEDFEDDPKPDTSIGKKKTA